MFLIVFGCYCRGLTADAADLLHLLDCTRISPSQLNCTTVLSVPKTLAKQPDLKSNNLLKNLTQL